jgi:xylose isomerase
MDADDLFHAHIGGVDVLARALLNAAAILEDGELDRFVAERYARWDEGLGADVLAGRASLADAAEYALGRNADPQPRSGRQEYLRTS